uniref:Endonuclease/exonuclease/phosphatase domain-containing protein n=1 Tax=Schistocephalus solidus TaxID=70667 RepID=A0A0X3PRH0_SCHSO
MYTNAQSILSKLDELKIHICDLSPDIISVTETWLSQHVDDREVNMAGYQLFRKDRKERKGGGVLTYVKSEITVLDKTYKLAPTSEAIWLSVKVPGTSSLDVLTVYRPPRRDPVADAYLLEELEKIATRLDILIMGDFNAPHIDWSLTCAHSSDLAFDGCFLSTTLKLRLT